MSIALKSTRSQYNEIIALPCFRVGAVLDGTLDQATSQTAATKIHSLFMDAFAADLKFAVLAPKVERKPTKATKATPKQLSAIQAALRNGMPDNSALRLYGSDENPLGVPFMPYLSISNRLGRMTEIELMIPWDLPELTQFADTVHQALCVAPVRFGYQGMGFGRSKIQSLPDQHLPLAYERFRAAIMGDFNRHPDRLLYRLDYLVNHSQPSQAGDYTPGLNDMGWRTYVGADFQGRLGDPDRARAAGVQIDEHATTLTVTAGPEPIWGDINAGEDLTVFAAAYAYLQPAYAEMRFLCKGMWGDRSPVEKAASQGYFQRLSRGAIS